MNKAILEGMKPHGKSQIQIPGNMCKVCRQPIVFSNEGKFCAQCEQVVHLTCLPQPECDVCGALFQQDERPEPDPLRDAIVPRAMRPVQSGAWVLAVSLGIGLLFIASIVLFSLQNLTGK